MDRSEVESYIRSYKDSYTREEIERKLLDSGVSKSEIDDSYNRLSGQSGALGSGSGVKKGKSGLALALVILGFFIPILGIIMIIIGIVLGFKARKINKNDGVALAAIILGFVSILLALLVVPIVAIVAFQTWFTTYQSGVNVKVEQQSVSGASLTVERLETDPNGIIFVKNNGVNDISVKSWKVMSDGVEQCSGTDVAGYNVLGSSVSSFTGTAACSVALELGKVYDVVVVSESGVYSSTIIAR